MLTNPSKLNRVLSKLSLNRDCCAKILEDKECLTNMMGILKIHRNGLFIVIRVAFTWSIVKIKDD